MDKDVLFLLHFVSTIFMTGVIWIVQLVHYPGFQFVEEKRFIDFEKFHKFKISLIVLPAMLIELFTGIFIILFHAKIYFERSFIFNLIILFIIWLITFVFSVPLHKKLENGKDLKAIRLLINTNWIRTFGWSIRLILLSFISFNI